VFCLGFVLSAEHFSNFKVSIREQKVPNVVAAIRKGIEKFARQQNIFICIL
jgi:hypothetical protein